MMEGTGIRKEEHNKIILGNDKTGFVVSSTVEANLLYAILEKLEEIRCCVIDVESAVNPR
jgi:hypothetical protein